MPSPASAEPTILAIESSCDESAAAIVRGGRTILASVIASQMDTHAAYGGVVPELASREHLRNIVPVVRQCLAQARLTLDQLDAIAVTEGPGLAGALLVGISYAKALALALDKPLIAVNHLEGHIHSVLLESSPATPALALVVSGGHTHLYLAEQRARSWSYRNLGHTLDDAAGEAFDKVAKLLGLPYPGGPWIDALAPFGTATAVPFTFAQIKPKIHRGQKPGGPQSFHFSFSGIKTAVARYVELNHLAASIEHRRAAIAALPALTTESLRALCGQQTLDLIASFQSAIVGDLLKKTFAAAQSLGVRSILISGGVAANSGLRRRFAAEAAARNLAIAFPSRLLSTDNAAMIAAAAYPKLIHRELASPLLTANPSLALGPTSS
jgi:N6-L-threonylcarbamoyladenine synthase